MAMDDNEFDALVDRCLDGLAAWREVLCAENPTPRNIIAAGIRQACSDVGTEFSYHEPEVDQRLLHKIHDEADSIADYILSGMSDATQADLAASERAMQMICATMSGGRDSAEKLSRIDRVVEAWVFHPDQLTPSAMIENLPTPHR